MTANSTVVDSIVKKILILSANKKKLLIICTFCDKIEDIKGAFQVTVRYADK